MTSKQFETALRDAAKENLRPEIDIEQYINVTLNEMWNGICYVDCDGDTYHEIPAYITRHGNPVVVP